MSDGRHVSARVATVVGLASLAAAMGIGRFAFTPIFPLMQQALGVTLAEGAWLATANYVGYLLGASATFVLVPRPEDSARWGLVAVALATLAMAVTGSLWLWLFLRLVAGVASAFVLIGASAWALAHLAALRRSELAGWVFAGVGTGICGAGLAVLALGTVRGAPAHCWAALGAIATVVALGTWRTLSPAAPTSRSDASAAPGPLGRAAWILVACYCALGFGYIIPATFIPAAARGLVQDPLVFGWAWPVFGLAAAMSTVGVTTFFRSTAPRRTAALSLLVMAVGVAAPAIELSLFTLGMSSVLVGGTFMVTTMAAVQEAKRMTPGNPTRLIAALTAAFALGQLAGPVVVSLSLSTGDGFTLPSAGAAALLLCSALALLLTEGDASPTDQELPTKGHPDAAA